MSYFAWVEIPDVRTVKDEGKTEKAGRLFRAKVPGGWLVSNAPLHSEGRVLTFLPDPNHDWDGNTLP